MMTIRQRLFLIPALVFCAAAPALAGITDLGAFGGSNSSANGISADGGVIVGDSDAAGDTHAFKYASGIMTDLGTLGGHSSTAYAVSADGGVIVGDSTLAVDPGTHAFEYTAAGGMIDLGTFGGTGTSASGISGDGSVIVGYSDIAGDSETHAFKYAAGLMTDLHTLGGASSYAYAASYDGGVIVGDSQRADTNTHAFKYTSADGMVDLGTLGGTQSYAYGVSGDGGVIVGTSFISGSVNSHAFKYTSADGMVDLGTLGGATSVAEAVSSDGRAIAGYSYLADDLVYHAFRYTAGHMTDLGTLGGANSYANAVSADGSVVAGTSELPGSVTHAFIYRSAMVDADNTVAAIARNAAQLNSVLNLKSALLVNALDSDCAVYGPGGVCLALDGWHYSGQQSGLSAQTASTLKASYRFGGSFRAGVLADLAFAETEPGNFSSDKTPLFGAFAVFGDNAAGRGAQLKFSAAYNKADTAITRTVLSNTEAGRGGSTLNGFGAKAALGYGGQVAGWDALPYAGLQWTAVSRGGYGETSGATFPVVYNGIAQRQLTALAGLKAERKYAALGLGAGAGIEQDLHGSMGAYKGAMDTLGSFALAAPGMTRTRPFADISASYDLGRDRRIGLALDVRRQSLGSAYGALVSGQYTAAF